VPCDEPGQLAEVLCELLSDRPRLERMGLAGRKWVRERFDWPALVEQARQIFNLSDAETAREPQVVFVGR
jgi:glycosyltransferase involved in cell wall biosynthesis